MPNSHGQPDSRYNAERRAERDLCEMLGLAKGVLADGRVNEEEALAFRTWFDSRPEVAAHWPGIAIARRLRAIYSDGSASQDELDDLRDLLSELTGGEAGVICGEVASSELPLDRPPPSIEVTNRVFVLTGRFALGPRKACEESVRRIGGWCDADVTQRTDYLVIGTFASRDWKTSAFGKKILKAMEYRANHGKPRILGEDHWAAHL